MLQRKVERKSQLNENFAPTKAGRSEHDWVKFLLQSVMSLTCSQGFTRFIGTVLGHEFADVIRPLQSTPPRVARETCRHRKNMPPSRARQTCHHMSAVWFVCQPKRSHIFNDDADGKPKIRGKYSEFRLIPCQFVSFHRRNYCYLRNH
jgi:hypothetical protein